MSYKNEEYAQRAAAEKAQQVMRQEMEQGVHKPQPTVAIKGEDRPLSIGAVFDEVIGVSASDVEVTQEAWAIINEHGEGLVLNFQQWAIVQKLVEAGIVSGRAGS